MKRVAIAVMTLALAAAATQADAQGRRNGQNNRARNQVARMQGIPPGQMPPANLCRVWYDDRSNGRQPAPTNCADAERIAARDRNARVIYGANVYDDRARYGGADDPWDPRYDPRDPRDRNDRAIPRVPGRNRHPKGDPDGGGYDPRDPYYERTRANDTAFKQGFNDGVAKGREDANDNDRYDARGHSWYRAATRGYDNDYGSRSAYQARYRDGFEAGYDEGYRTPKQK